MSSLAKVSIKSNVKPTGDNKVDINAYIAQAATQGPDMTKASSGGGTGAYTPPPEGPALFRLTSYVEIGNQKTTFQGQEKIKPQVIIGFDVFGKNYPVQDINGEKVPVRISLTESMSLHEKANFRKLFDILRGNDNSVRHFSQLLGRPFRGRIYHDNWTTADGNKRTKLTIKSSTGYNIGAPVAEDPETGEVKTIVVPEAVSKLRLFLWDFATKEMWDSIFIDGEYSSGNSKNIFQEKIRGAENFTGSKIEQVLNGGSPVVEQAASQVKRPGAFRPSFGRPATTQAPVVEAFDRQQSQPQDDADYDPFGNWDEGQE